jgi:hypothetical protein
LRERIKKIKKFEDNLEDKETNATSKMVGKIEETKKNKNPFKSMFQIYGYKVIRLKYFIMVAVALALEVITVTIYLLNIENILEFEVFTASVLFGATSAIIVVLAVGVMTLVKVDRTRDKKNIEQLLSFKRSYQKLKSKYLNDIYRFSKVFNSKKNNINVKINYAIILGDVYNNFLKKFSKIKVPEFLKEAYDYELKHLTKEKQFYEKFSLFSKRDDLKNYNIESSLAHIDYLREINRLEKSLKLTV